MRGQVHFVLICVFFSGSVKFSDSVLQQRLVKSNFLPTSSCIEVANQTQSSILCSANCLKINSENVVFSRHVVSTRCVCCRRLLTGTNLSSTDWITYKQDGAHVVYSDCPKGYIDINSSTIRTCLRLELTRKPYNDAAIRCQADGGDLIRIDSAEKYTIFLQFIASHETATDDEIWIQSFRDPNNTWIFHDTTVMPELCPLALTNFRSENRILYHIKNDLCLDRQSEFSSSYVCEV